MDNEIELSKEELSSIVEQNLEQIIILIKENYPDIDIFSKIRYTDSKTTKKIIDEVREKNKGTKLFYVDIPYFGVVVYRYQTLKDTREVAAASLKFSEQLIKENGGVDKINSLPENERNIMHQKINDQTGDFINLEAVKRCVLYPYNIADLINTEEVPYGIIPVLMDVISESSGYQNVRIEEI